MCYRAPKYINHVQTMRKWKMEEEKWGWYLKGPKRPLLRHSKVEMAKRAQFIGSACQTRQK